MSARYTTDAAQARFTTSQQLVEACREGNVRVGKLLVERAKRLREPLSGQVLKLAFRAACISGATELALLLWSRTDEFPWENEEQLAEVVAHYTDDLLGRQFFQRPDEATRVRHYPFKLVEGLLKATRRPFTYWTTQRLNGSMERLCRESKQSQAALVKRLIRACVDGGCQDFPEWLHQAVYGLNEELAAFVLDIAWSRGQKELRRGRALWDQRIDIYGAENYRRHEQLARDTEDLWDRLEKRESAPREKALAQRLAKTADTLKTGAACPLDFPQYLWPIVAGYAVCVLADA